MSNLNFPGSTHGGMYGPKPTMSKPSSSSTGVAQDQSHKRPTVGGSDLNPSAPSSSANNKDFPGSQVGPDHPIFSYSHSTEKRTPPHHPSGIPVRGEHDVETPEARFDPFGPPGTSASRGDPNPDITTRPQFTQNDDDYNDDV